MKNSQKGFIVPLIIIGVLLIIAAGSYYFIDQKKAEAPILSSQTQTTATITSNQIAGWKTYTNTNYGLQLKYPNTWQIVDQNNDVLIVKIADSQHLPEPNMTTGKNTPSNIFFVRTIGDLDLDYLNDGQLPSDSGWSTSMNGIFGGYERTIYNKGKNINIVMDALTPAAQKLDDQILSTLVFTSQ